MPSFERFAARFEPPEIATGHDAMLTSPADLAALCAKSAHNWHSFGTNACRAVGAAAIASPP